MAPPVKDIGQNPRCFICQLPLSSSASEESLEILKEEVLESNDLDEFERFTKDFGKRDKSNSDDTDYGIAQWKKGSVCEDCRLNIKAVLRKKTQIEGVETRVLTLQTELLVELGCLQRQLDDLYENMKLIEEKINKTRASSLTSKAKGTKRTRSRRGDTSILLEGDDSLEQESFKKDIVTVINNLSSFRTINQSRVNSSNAGSDIKGNTDTCSVVKTEPLSDPEDNVGDSDSDFCPDQDIPSDSDHDRGVDEVQASDDEDYEPQRRKRKSSRNLTVKVEKPKRQDTVEISKPKREKRRSKPKLDDDTAGDSESVKCPDCGKTLTNINCLRKHKWRSCSAGKVGGAYPCPSCKLSFRTKLLLNRHQKKVHPIIDTRTTFECTYCNKSFNNKYYMNVHRKAVHECRFSCELCGKMFSKLSQMNLHKANVHGVMGEDETFFKCDVCGRLSRTRRGHLKHLETHKSLEERTTEACPYCKMEMLSCNMRPHLARSCPAKTSKMQPPIVCYLCGEAFSDRLKLKLHKRSCKAAANNTADNFICYLCGKQGFKNRLLLKKHVQRHGNSCRRQFMCGKCGGSFTAGAHLKRHEQWCDGTKIPRKPRNGDMLQPGPNCEPRPWVGNEDGEPSEAGQEDTREKSECQSTSAETERTLRGPEEEVSGGKGGEMVDNISDSEDNSDGDLDGAYDDDDFSDSEMDDTPEEESKKMPEKKGDDESADPSPSKGDTTKSDKDDSPKDYTCNECGKVYNSLLGLQCHQNTHSHTRAKFACQFCPKMYSTKVDLAVHLANIHKQKNPPGKLHLYECSVCGTKGANEEKMQLHEETHLQPEERTRKICELCGKGVLPKSYAAHVQINCPSRKGIGEQRVICPQCGNGYENAYKLRRHMERIHTPEWGGYSCKICEKTGFKNKQSLGVHMRKHAADRPRDFRCIRCGGGYTTMSHLRRHERGCDGSKKPRKPRYSSMIKPESELAGKV